MATMEIATEEEADGSDGQVRLLSSGCTVYLMMQHLSGDNKFVFWVEVQEEHIMATAMCAVLMLQGSAMVIES